MSHKKFGPDRFSRFDVYWIHTDKQTSQILYIEVFQTTLFKRLTYNAKMFVYFFTRITKKFKNYDIKENTRFTNLVLSDFFNFVTT